VYVYRGRGQLGGKDAKLGDWVVLENDGDQFTISCPPDAKEINVLLFAGMPINEPVCGVDFRRS
jgi:redox-sensitive bicupin YhaK (pirin superfamily)